MSATTIQQQKLAEDSHEISSFIWFLKSVTNFNVVCCNILVASQGLIVNIPSADDLS